MSSGGAAGRWTRADAAAARADGPLKLVVVVALAPNPGAQVIVPGDAVYCAEAEDGPNYVEKGFWTVIAAA